MNKKNLITLINEFIIARNEITESDNILASVTTNLQVAQPSDIVFYRVSQDDNSKRILKERLLKNTPGILILNHGAEYIKNDNCIFIDGDNFLKLQKIICDQFFPDKNTLKLIGVTGTNGKTTTVNLAMQISTMLGHPAIALGTIGICDASGEISHELDSTTPSYVELRKIIYSFQDKYQACFLEISSHALAQDRLFNLRLDECAWTSFSQDHLDYHKTMDEYFGAKILVERKYLKADRHLLLPSQEKELILKISTESPNSRYEIAKTLSERAMHELPLFYHSSYNQSNVELALALNEKLWGNVGVEKIQLNKIQTPKGRFSIIELSKNKLVIIDYAHTPDALLNIGAAIKQAFKNYSLTVVFGCGGNRDRTKRPLMAKAVSSFADKIMITSDNPRDEAPEDIIIDIIGGMTGSYEAVVDRTKAINFCLTSMKDNEIVLIAGKGHEEYQEIKGVKLPFSDFLVVQKYKEEN
jgi:UDP-N-acetylmuramoyl-L-alanyl-D-glutamate--2,6-diaminopimelate ligase